MRLQRLLAAAGFGSRRQCEELIETGRVDIDGQVVTQLGTTVDPTTQKVRVDGVPLKKQKLVYYAVNKPVGKRDLISRAGAAYSPRSVAGVNTVTGSSP